MLLIVEFRIFLSIFLTRLGKIMKVQSIQNYAFRGTPDVRNKSWLDKIHEKTKNSADMTDTIVVPRTIFKGYLGIMTGTTLVTVGSLLSQKMKKISRVLSIAGLLTSLYGTYAFVRPFIIKDAPGVEKTKKV